MRWIDDKLGDAETDWLLLPNPENKVASAAVDSAVVAGVSEEELPPQCRKNRLKIMRAGFKVQTIFLQDIIEGRLA